MTAIVLNVVLLTAVKPTVILLNVAASTILRCSKIYENLKNLLKNFNFNVPGKIFQPSLMLLRKARAYLREAPFKCFVVR